ncbi:sialate O-acetylesterase [Acinetobacter baumannii]|uniref:sialate O-acetylesterase n=1 Tax=Acinetobacter baumannii TaxID=470 RepID=UPI00280F7712|nr:hypothetical protein [Acinetobacter baumannii]
MPLPTAAEITDPTATNTQMKQRLAQLVDNIDRSYPSLLEANNDIVNIPVGVGVEVLSGEDSGKYYKASAQATTLTKNPYDPLSSSKAFTVEEVGRVSEKISVNFEKIEILKTDTNPSVIPVLVDESNKTLIGYDTEKDQIEAGGLQEQVLENLPNLMKSEDTSKIAVLTDSANKILIGYDTENDKAIIAGLELPNLKPLVAEINHLIGYGQSLKTGATATVILSTSQPYANVTFNTGPRKDSAATSLIPLVEQFNNPSSDGYANRGETCCSGAANYASRSMMLENGIDPEDHVILASTAAHGGYRIDQLKKGTPWYSFFLEHITEAKRLSDSKTYKTQAVDWGQGENDAVSGGIQTPYGIYKPELAQLQIDASNDIKAITGQQDSVPFITYQMSYSAATWPDIAKAQLDLVRENDFFMLSTPMYHFPYATDKVHLTSIGYKWFGAYVGRAYKQYVIEGRKSDFINPLSAKIVDNQIIIKFDVPTLPLQIDTTTLAITTNHGFKVMNGTNEITISSVTAFDDTVILQLSSSPADDVQVRYALDYLGAGLAITGGASGNLRDSTTDSVMISGVEKPLYHVCPHFELTAFIDKGI